MGPVKGECVHMGPVKGECVHMGPVKGECVHMGLVMRECVLRGPVCTTVNMHYYQPSVNKCMIVYGSTKFTLKILQLYNFKMKPES